MADATETTPTTATTGLDPSQSTLSANFAPYVNQMLSMGAGAAMQPYQPYTGERFAGPSELQQQAFQGIAGLGTPSQFGTATQMATQAGQTAGGLGYSPTQFGNQFTAPGAYQTGQFQNQFAAPGAYQAQAATSGYQAPGAYAAAQFANQYRMPEAYTPSAGPQYSSVSAQNVTSDYRSPAAYQAGQFQNLFKAPSAYQAADLTGGIGGQSYKAGEFDTQLGPLKSVQDYMSQYTTGVSDVAAREATRQADISRQSEQARLAQAGAYGGSRQAIMEAERQKNLGTQISDIRTQGLQAAFDRAQQQRLQEAGMGMEAQKATEGSRQFGAQFGQQGLGQLLQARQASEASRQFGATQGMTAQQLQAQFGLSAQQAQEASRQFGYGQQMTSAQLQAQFGLDAQKANQMAQLQAATSNQQASLEAARQAEQSRQYGYGQQMAGAQLGAQYGLSSLQAGEASRQFGAQQAMTGAETASRLGLQAQQQTTQDRQFGATQGMNAAQLQAQYGLSAQQAQEMSRQFGAQQGMTAAQTAAQYGLAGQREAEQSRQFGAQYGLQGLQSQLQAAQTLGGLGTQQQQAGLAGLNAMLGAGGTQQQLAQQEKDFGYQQFQESMKYPYQQATYMQSLLQGLPLKAPEYNSGDSGLFSGIQGGVAGLGLYEALFGKQP